MLCATTSAVRAKGNSVADDLADQHQVDTTGQLLVDLHYLADVAVLVVNSLGPHILEREAVLSIASAIPV